MGGITLLIAASSRVQQNRAEEALNIYHVCISTTYCGRGAAHTIYTSSQHIVEWVHIAAHPYPKLNPKTQPQPKAQPQPPPQLAGEAHAY